MKKLFALMCLAFFGVSTCSSPRPIESPHASKKEIVERLERTTVALVLPSDEGKLLAYCGGVWVDQLRILTAKHCVESMPIIAYEVFGDTHEKITRIALVEDTESATDLALLSVDPLTAPEHPVATFGEDIWTGQRVNIIGHTTGMWWTYIDGVVSSESLHGQPIKDIKPCAIQISSAAWFGNSGGGAFDDAGNLIGISSWITTKAPMMSFFIYKDAIKKFLVKNYSGG